MIQSLTLVLNKLTLIFNLLIINFIRYEVYLKMEASNYL